jgi:hypothetical protein
VRGSQGPVREQDHTTPTHGLSGSTPRRQALTLGDGRTQIIDNSRALGFAATVPTDTYAKVLSPSSEVREHWHIHCFIASLVPRRP